MDLPEEYHWLEAEPGPRVLLEMRKIHGVREAQGEQDNPEILSWAQELGIRKVGIDYRHDSEAWCGLAMGIVVFRAGYEPPPICVRASSWDAFGVQSKVPMLGDVLRFQRPGGGHVGLYVGEDKEAFHVWGGNQSDSVCFTRILKNRLVAARRCDWAVHGPYNIRRVFLTTNGSLSDNEA